VEIALGALPDADPLAIKLGPAKVQLYVKAVRK
jgi:hypothetical protein